MSVYYPIFLDLQGKRCLVVGGGDMAARKVQGLLEAGAAVVVSPLLTEALAELAQSGSIRHAARLFERRCRRLRLSHWGDGSTCGKCRGLRSRTQAWDLDEYQGPSVDLQPSQPKLGALVKEAAQRSGELLRQKGRVP